MNIAMKSMVLLFDRMGYDLVKKKEERFSVELDGQERNLFSFVRDRQLSMVNEEALYSTILACKYVLDRNIEGDFVECGVWRGGNAILAAGTFKMHRANRKTYLYDTFAGMTQPSDLDRNRRGQPAMSRFEKLQKDGYNEWAFSSIDEVKNNFDKANLLDGNVVFIKGDVLKTLSEQKLLPNRISIMRLDTDWYESTKFELEVLWPRLSAGGVIIIDDYGTWSGSKKAVDEYFEKNGSQPFLQRAGHGARVGVKCA